MSSSGQAYSVQEPDDVPSALASRTTGVDALESTLLELVELATELQAELTELPSEGDGAGEGEGEGQGTIASQALEAQSYERFLAVAQPILQVIAGMGMA